MIQALLYDDTCSTWVVVRERYFMVSVVVVTQEQVEYTLKHEGLTYADVPNVRRIGERAEHMDVDTLALEYPMRGKTLVTMYLWR